MSTAIKQAIEKLQNRRDEILTKDMYDAGMFNALNLSIHDLKNLLHIEKQDLQKAWDGGHEKGYNQCEKDEHGYSPIEPDYYDFDQFYNELKGE